MAKGMREILASSARLLVMDDPKPNHSFGENEVELVVLTKAQFAEIVLNVEYIIARDALLETRIKAMMELVRKTKS